MEDKNKYDKYYYKIMTYTMLIILSLTVILNLTKEDILFSELENRMLTQKPKFSVERLLEGRYTKKYEKYKVDQFINRDKFISIKSTMDLALGKNKSNGIYKCEEDYLIEEFSNVESKNVDLNLEAINDFYKSHKAINQYVLIAPNAVSIMNDKLPPYAPTLNQKEYLNDFRNKLNKNIKYIDTYDTLKNKNDEYIYYKTDHHWTTLGAYYAYTDLCKQMNIEKSSYEIQRVSNDFYGTLYSKSGYQTNSSDYIDIFIPKNQEDEYIVNYIEEQKKSASLYVSENLNIKDKYSVFLDGNHPIVKIKTTSNSDRKLLMFKDSYANSFTPFLTSNFSDITLVDPRYYYDDIDKLIKDENISDILYLYNASTFFNDTSLNLVLNNN